MDVLPHPPLASFVRLDAHTDRVALITPEGELTYGELAQRVGDMASRFGNGRKLVLVAAGNELPPLVAYLACLHAGHAALLAPGDKPQAVAALVKAYDPDVVVTSQHGAWDVVERRRVPGHAMHPELSLLLPTSGSTGSPKLVRLSHANLQANAEAITAGLDIRDTDRAMTSLPMHYSYGLSVVNTHLLQGATLVLTRASVVDRCFWDAFRAAHATSFAGVPYTFDLLDRIGFAAMSLPSLRYVTQAGGRLDPGAVQRYAELGHRRGWRFYVMYGQTEATARMACLPPDMARSHPTAIGFPVRGGSFELEPIDDAGGPDEGELLYRGPNVMLGYAEGPADLAAGRTVDVLRTGDIARRLGDGLYEIVGRRSRFLKLFGQRIDLDQVERVLAAEGIGAVCTGDDDTLVVAIGVEVGSESVQRLVHRHFGLPPSRVSVKAYADIPRLGNGKPDYVAIRAPLEERGPEARTVRDLFARVLRRDDVDDSSTFVSLGGDSLSYVEMSAALEELLGHLPTDWHITPLHRLRPAASPSRLVSRVETNVVLRAVSIVLVVGSHARLFSLRGGAHVLLAVAGFNFARFQLASADAAPVRRMWKSIGRIALPAIGLSALLTLAADRYGWANVLLVNNYLGGPQWDERWRYWYIEALVQILAVLAVAFSVPRVRRWERRHGFGVAMGLVLLGLCLRFELVDVGDATRRFHRPHTVLWVFALGWAAARATSIPRRLAVSALVVMSVWGFFGDGGREAVVAGGLLLLLWVPRVAVVRPFPRAIRLLAGSSLFIYLTHFHVYPPLLRRYSPAVVVVMALGVGVASWCLARRITGSRRSGYGVVSTLWRKSSTRRMSSCAAGSS